MPSETPVTLSKSKSFDAFLCSEFGLKGNSYVPFPLWGGDELYLLSDSRQQEGKHKNIEDYCRRNGITMIRKCLPCGDYMLSEDGETPSGNVIVDTKQDCMELCKDIMSNDHRRFRRQCERAQELGLKLIILVEETVPYGRVDMWEVPRWKNSNEWHRYGDPMTRVNPATFQKALKTMTTKYGVQFRFCTRRQSPARVIKYLKGEFR